MQGFLLSAARVSATFLLESLWSNMTFPQSWLVFSQMKQRTRFDLEILCVRERRILFLRKWASFIALHFMTFKKPFYDFYKALKVSKARNVFY